MMRRRKRTGSIQLRQRVLMARALLLVLLVLGACATRGQVEAIVAESNAALVGPYVDIAEEDQPGDWEQAFANIERFIEAHPDNASLVNHLRVRQALLLTANRRRNLANQYWGLVDPDALDSERDRALAGVGEELSWWYEVAPDDRAVVAGDEADAARTALSTVIASTAEGSDIRIYLSTIRVQLVERAVRDSDPMTDDESDSLGVELVSALERYIGDIGADGTWIADVDSLEDDDLSSAKQIRSFRYRIWLKEMIRSYKSTAVDLGLDEDELSWRPAWVDGMG